MVRMFIALVAAVGVLISPITAKAELSPMELGRAHSQCHALRLLLPSAGMDHVAFLERHKRGHFLSLSPIFGAYKAEIDANYELGYALAAEGRVTQNQLFEAFCEGVEGLERSPEDSAPFAQCVHRLRLVVFEPSRMTDEFQDFALDRYEAKGCRTLRVPQS